MKKEGVIDEILHGSLRLKCILLSAFWGVGKSKLFHAAFFGEVTLRNLSLYKHSFVFFVPIIPLINTLTHV